MRRTSWARMPRSRAGRSGTLCKVAGSTSRDGFAENRGSCGQSRWPRRQHLSKKWRPLAVRTDCSLPSLDPSINTSSPASTQHSNLTLEGRCVS